MSGSQFVSGPNRAFTAGAAIGAWLRVKFTAGKLALAGATDVAVGVTTQASAADGDKINVRLLNAQGTIKMTAGAAIAQFAEVWAGANGKLAAAAGGGALRLGIALEAASGDGSVIEVLTYAHGGALT